MRKRLIGKAFAIAMSGAMVLTATPVTANIFHVASPKKGLLMNSLMNMFIAMLDLPGMNIGHLRVFMLPVMTALLIH